ncbi:MAG TPA: oligopeptide ABC transporter substrate-binding protein [Atopostipes sp.]|nr:oligopeptide ABC transporter substrate-binding protein [Atopostipes sp.]
MSLKRKYGLLASSAAVALLLAACGGDTGTEGDTGGDSTEVENGETDGGVELPEFEAVVENEGEPIEGGTLRVAMVADSAFPGIFSTEFYGINLDSQLMGPMLGDLLRQDEQYQWTDGAASMEYDQDENVATITLQEGVLWHDGEEVTVDDVVFTHEIVGHPDYNGVRYSEAFQAIEGMPEYNAGEADTISGLEVVDDYTLRIHYTEPQGPAILQAGGGIWAYAAPRHHYGDVPVDEIESAPQVRENPIGFGPYKVANIVPGESVEYEAFEDYFEGAPNIDRIVVERVPTSGIVEALRSGDFDVTWNMPANLYDSFEEGIPGYTTLGSPGQSYDYISFKVGEWDAEEGKNVYNPDAKMADKSLRQAMGYALDIDAVGAEFYNGLRYRADSHIIPNFGDFYNPDIEGYPFDEDKANELLDEAGYEDVDGDGIREDPNGDPLTINYAARANSDAAEPIALYFIQAWNKVGLDVQLLEGRLHEVNSFYDRVEADDPKIDVHEGGWGTGSDPTPDGLYGETAAFNFPRFVSDENNAYMADMLSEEGFDTEWRLGVFHEWQEYFMDEAVSIPTFWRTELQLVNDRVSTWSHDMVPGADPATYGWHSIELLADEPVTE